MNILFTFFVPSGGVETLNRQRFYALSQKGINCHFLYLQKGIGLRNKIDTQIFITNSDQEIKSIIENGNYTAIVVSSDYHLLPKLRQIGYKGPLIYEVQGLGSTKEYADHFLRNYADQIQYCDAVLYPQTPHLIEAFKKNLPTKKQFCFHNCINTDFFKYINFTKSNRKIIGWVGRIEENKNWKDFLTIGAELVKNDPSLMLWMFEDNTLGSKSERVAFEQTVEHLGLRQNLTIFANQPHDKMALYFSIIGDSGGFLCSTSKVEGFGYAVLEAMVCRCPVLSTDSDGVRSFIKHNITGNFFEFGNISQAVQEAKELMSNIELREKIRERAIEHIGLHFSPSKYTENFLGMINALKNANEQS